MNDLTDTGYVKHTIDDICKEITNAICSIEPRNRLICTICDIFKREIGPLDDRIAELEAELQKRTLPPSHVCRICGEKLDAYGACPNDNEVGQHPY